MAAGCGGGDDPAKDAGADAPLAADLTVTLRPNGAGGPARSHRIRCQRLGTKSEDQTCRSLAGLSADQLEPVPSGTACTQIFGGPAVARVSGQLHGQRVDARFELTNGCEIERWDRNRVLLGDAPAAG
ncbi:MAG: hypothetical protein QOE60_2432 [Thermoleophilaceae bacterium]|nr:hypothetical protein [Thermoleophilaceae bacterium]